MYEMYEDDTTDSEGGLEYKSEDNQIPVMATILDCQVPMLEMNENYVKATFNCSSGR